MPSEPEEIAALLQQLSALVNNPHEDLSVECKDWLDLSDNVARAKIARHLIALANHGGGFLMFGFAEDTSGGFSATDPPEDVSAYTQDVMNNICSRYLEPTFQCTARWQATSAGTNHFVVRVPGTTAVPIRSKRAAPAGSDGLRIFTYYIRKPGPESAPIDSGRDWDRLLRRCIGEQRGQLLENIRLVVESALGGSAPAAPNRGKTTLLTAITKLETRGWERFNAMIEESSDPTVPGRYRYGTWSATYQVEPPIDPPLSMPELKRALETSVGRESGWPAWWLPTLEANAPRVVDSGIECWMGHGTFLDGAHSDFWRAEPSGSLFLARGYQEDTPDADVPPGTIFDLTIPVWRVGEILLHAQRFAYATNASDAVMAIKWTGLKGRELRAWSAQDRMVTPRMCHEDHISSRIAFDVDEVSSNLPDLVRSLVAPLYAAFEFLEPPNEIYSQELERMRNGP